MKTILLISSCSIFLAVACSSMLRKEPKDMENKDVPGIVFLNDHFGMDATEITNFHWLEFLYWTTKKYGRESEQYSAILPDTTVWTALDTGYRAMQDFYLRHPAFRDYPVIGISYEQAVAYCKWRSDRVFEYYLVKQHLIPWDYCLSSNKDSLVTIERYKKGLISGIKPSASITKLPHYRLPSKQEWEQAQEFLQTKSEKLSGKAKKQLAENSNPDSYHDLPIPNCVEPRKSKQKYTWIYHLDRNVSEWLNDGKSVAGANWRGQTEIDEHSNSKEAKGASSTIGFRCVFEWQ